MTATNGSGGNGAGARRIERDVVVVGAGFAGLYLLHTLRSLGFSTTVLESADDVGGTWYWNRYPGARCDIESIDYSYSFDPELEKEWQWSERYATQPEILRYLGHVADKHDLRRDIRFSTRVDVRRVGRRRGTVAGAHRPRGRAALPVLRDGDRVPLRRRRRPTSPGYDRFRGESYYTGRWPHDGRRLHRASGWPSSARDRRASSPSRSSRAQAAELVVFQRTPNFSRPACNGPVPATRQAAFDADPVAYREAARWSRLGVPHGAVHAARLPGPGSRAPRQVRGGLRVGRPPCARQRLRRHLAPTPRPTRLVVRVPARQDPLDRAGSRRRPRRSARRTTSTAPSVRASTPTTSRPSTCPTCAWSTCGRSRSARSPRRASTRRRAPSSSTPSCSPPGSTR